MASSNAASGPDATTMKQLVQGLEHMRDSLVNLSLILQDYRFELNCESHLDSNQAVAQMVQRMRRS